MSKGISHPVFYVDLVYKLRRVKDTPNFISSGSKIVKRLRRRQYDPLIIERTIGLVFGPSTAFYRPFSKHCTLTMRRGLYDGPCPNLLRGDKVLIFVPSDCKSGLLQPSDLISLPDGRSIACPIRMSLYLFLIYNIIYYLCYTCIDFNYLSAWGVCCLYKVYLQFFLMCVLLMTRLLRGVGRLSP